MKAAVALMLLSSLGASVALATPPIGQLALANYTLVIDPDSSDRVRIKLPAASECEEDAPITRGSRSPVVFMFQVYTAYPSSYTGWHYHPGILLATVADGSIEWYDAKCVTHVRKMGDFFVEHDHEIHEVWNPNAVPARIIITFVIKKGLTYKISAPAPSCAKARGLP
jgi:quercetin dioxygenase-like cupin family protein